VSVNKDLILVLGDIHFPWQHQGALEKVIETVGAERPGLIVQIGDLKDQFMFGRYAKSLNVVAPRDELEWARGQAEVFFDRLHVASPQTSKHLIFGNHDDRIMKGIRDKSPQHDFMVSDYVEELYTFPHVETHFRSNEELILDGICYQHGHRSKLGDHARYNQMNTVTGHSHQGGVVFHRNLNGVYWELNAGWLGDENAEVFNYREQKKITTWTLGLGRIERKNGVWCPAFVPYPRNVA
jgi:predicted phosphodiesterase